MPLLVIETVNMTSSPGAAWSGLTDKSNESGGAASTGVSVTVGVADGVALVVDVAVFVNWGVEDGPNVAVGLADGVASGVDVAVLVNTGGEDGPNVTVGLADGVALGVGVALPVDGAGVIVGVFCPGFSNHTRSLSMKAGPALTGVVVSLRSDCNAAAAAGKEPIALNRNTKIRPRQTIVFKCWLNLNMNPS